MKLTIENTTKVVELNGVPARIWEGQTDSGIPVHCYITLVVVKDGLDCTQFERELAEQRKPSVDRAIFEEAIAGYRMQAIKELDSMLKEALEGRRIRRAEIEAIPLRLIL